MKIQINELESLVKKILSSKYSEEETDLMTSVIMFGELSETKSHGIIRIPSILDKPPKSKVKVINKKKVSGIVEGHGNPGMLVGAIACNKTVEIATECGIAVVGTHGSVSSSGCLSYYAEKIALENLIGIIMARAPADVAPYGGVERLFGTNPVAFGIPADNSPLIFDMATSAISWGAVDRARKLGQKLPPNVAINPGGKITTDPAEALKGAFLTFDNSYKGYGLSMVVEILAGVLPGADFLDLAVGDEWGNTFIAIDPNILSNLSEFKKRVRLLVEKVRNSKSLDNNKIRIPGENRIRLRDDNLKKGRVEVDDLVYNSVFHKQSEK